MIKTVVRGTRQNPVQQSEDLLRFDSGISRRRCMSEFCVGARNGTLFHMGTLPKVIQLRRYR